MYFQLKVNSSLKLPFSLIQNVAVNVQIDTFNRINSYKVLGGNFDTGFLCNDYLHAFSSKVRPYRVRRRTFHRRNIDQFA